MTMQTIQWEVIERDWMVQLESLRARVTRLEYELEALALPERQAPTRTERLVWLLEHAAPAEWIELPQRREWLQARVDCLRALRASNRGGETP